MRAHFTLRTSHVLQALLRRCAWSPTEGGSSRAHCVVEITSTVTLQGPAGRETRVGRLCLVDLAGCRRPGEANKAKGAEGIAATAEDEARFREGVQINADLSALRAVMKAKAARASKEALGVLIRRSRLTRELAGPLGFGVAVTLIVHVSAAAAARSDALQSLTFGMECQ